MPKPRKEATPKKPVGAVLLDARHRLGLTRQEVAVPLGIRENDLYRYEIDGTKMPPELFSRLLVRYELGADEFLERLEKIKTRMADATSRTEEAPREQPRRLSAARGS